MAIIKISKNNSASLAPSLSVQNVTLPKNVYGVMKIKFYLTITALKIAQKDFSPIAKKYAQSAYKIVETVITRQSVKNVLIIPFYTMEIQNA